MRNRTPLKGTGKNHREMAEETEMIKNLTQKLKQRKSQASTSPRNGGRVEEVRSKMIEEKRTKEKKGPLSVSMFSF